MVDFAKWARAYKICDEIFADLNDRSGIDLECGGDEEIAEEIRQAILVIIFNGLR